MKAADSDLWVIVAIAVLTIPMVTFTEGVVRMALGLALVFWTPGYALLAALELIRDDLSFLQRVALSLAMSLVLVPLVGLALNFTPWGVRPVSYATALAMVTVALAMVALRRWWFLRALGAGWMSPLPDAVVTAWSARQWVQQRVSFSSALVAGSAFTLMGSVLWLTLFPKVVDTFTEFYLLGPEGKLQEYPLTMALGAVKMVTVGIANREGRSMSYRVRAGFEGGALHQLGPVHLGPEERWEQAVELRPHVVGPRQRVLFQLYGNEDTEPNRFLHLWVDVVSGAVADSPRALPPAKSYVFHRLGNGRRFDDPLLRTCLE